MVKKTKQSSNTNHAPSKILYYGRGGFNARNSDSDGSDFGISFEIRLRNYGGGIDNFFNGVGSSRDSGVERGK